MRACVGNTVNYNCVSQVSVRTARILSLTMLLSKEKEKENPVAHQSDLKNEDRSLPLMFPIKMIDSTKPILTGDDPTSINLPPRKFPTASLEPNSASPPILSIADAANITALKASHESKVNVTVELPAVKTISAGESSNIQKNVNGTEKQISEQDDMLHSKYNGGHDVDELKAGKELTEEEKKILDEDKKPSGNEKKASEKDEKKSKTPSNDKAKDPKSEFDLSSKFNSNGPKSMNETKAKAGESVLESTSKMMVVSSSVLSSTKVRKPNGIIEPSQTIISVLLSVAFILGVGIIGILVWKKISMRKFGRDVLINEDDFDEISDMHTFERTQIQIT